jgi:hypothetical protein
LTPHWRDARQPHRWFQPTPARAFDERNRGAHSLLAWDRDAAFRQTAVPIAVLPAEGMSDPADGESIATRCDIGPRLPGGHFSFVEAPKETARFIAECLAT